MRELSQINKTNPGAQRNRTKESLTWFTFAGLALIFVAVIAVLFGQSHGTASTMTGRIPSLKGPQTVPKTLAGLLALSASQLASLDIARMNLLCAEGLFGAETLDVDGCLAALDSWAAHVQSETERYLYKFRANPAEFENSEGYFRMLMMSVVAYEDFGIRYNPERISSPIDLSTDDQFFRDSRDVLLHGLLGHRRMGTCSSMPVLYVALGRRLGYPLKLVKTKAHLFIRWESPAEKFDLEATGKGMNKYDDSHFKVWPFPLSDQEINENAYLKSLSPAEELSVFLSIRGECLTESGNLGEAAKSFEAAYHLAPDWKGNKVLLAAARDRLARSKAAALPNSPGSLDEDNLITKNK
jgi:hypothetical protein